MALVHFNRLGTMTLQFQNHQHALQRSKSRVHKWYHMAEKRVVSALVTLRDSHLVFVSLFTPIFPTISLNSIHSLSLFTSPSLPQSYNV